MHGCQEELEVMTNTRFSFGEEIFKYVKLKGKKQMNQ